jgi:hypothetical protein
MYYIHYSYYYDEYQIFHYMDDYYIVYGSFYWLENAESYRNYLNWDQYYDSYSYDSYWYDPCLGYY